MTGSRRLRCPLCGLVAWPTRLTGGHPIEGAVQISVGGGHARKGYGQPGGRGQGFRYGSWTAVSDTELRILARASEALRRRLMDEAQRRGLA